ncbi:MAG: periplasmic heavy metal sensor [Bacteroidota bacterium]
MNIFEKQRFFVVLSAVLLVLNLVLIAIMVAPDLLPREKGSRGGSPINYMSRELGFDEQQKQQLTQIANEHRGEIRKLKDDVERLRSSLFAELSRSEVDPQKRDELLSAIGSTTSEMERSTLLFFSSIRSICTDEQLPRFEEMAANIHKRIGLQRRGSRGGERERRRRDGGN